MNRRDFVCGSVLACASTSLALPALADAGRQIVFRLDNREGESELSSFVSSDEKNVIDRLVLPQATRLVEHPSLPVLFALLDVDAWQHRSRSAVCCVHYYPSTGKFVRHDVTPLSLGAVGITKAEVRENGRRLLITTSSGIRNTFRLSNRGDVAELVSVRKTISSLPGKGHS